MIMAVFGDAHGNLDGMFEAVQGYEQYNQATVQGILQAGDLGAFGRQN